MKKNLFKTLFVLSILLLTNSIIAQNNMTFNVGYINKSNKAQWAEKIVGVEANGSDTVVFNGFTVGLEYFLLSNEVFGLDLGLNYSYLTRDVRIGLGNGFSGFRYTYHMLDAPARLMLSLRLSDNFKLLLFGGPKFTFDLAGSRQAYLNGDKEGSPEDHYSKDSYRSRFDILLGPGIGLRYKNLILRGGYDFGLLNLNINDNVNHFLSNQKLRITQEQLYVKLGLAF